ncbi:storkhead-box protein 1 [Hypanus sabinus]|uniref:storkhead-box protein 1 n=1 Tax=Hypanus sabinus TaxID=79690 RepID=UPI0028C41597|nr:storkhead-box protein 1 [Hypanus sabinus]XP_059803291.1 storkhead-box protein 1 [Hypanus sabinus]
MLVELTRSSLALVLGAGSSAPDAEPDLSRNGQQLFAELKAENGRSVWNERLVHAVSELQLLGWLHCGVLLLGGRASHLEVLREAWIRRALRPPRGFRIRAVGDVSPIPMMPIAQSQFVPLTEVLCCVISEMNESHVTVTQEALMDYLVQCYPGIASPSQEILHNALGTLIRDRKIYHTEEGYFIVTSHTYFITGNAGKQNRPWMLSGNHAPSLPPVTYLVSVESCENTPRGKGLPGTALCDSCCCFNAQLDAQDKGICREPKPSVQHRATSTATGHQGTEPSRSKEKGNPIRKFGLGLFRRNTKKESPKREYGTFSAQFPPEEWPVIDENSLGDIPRDVELQIIKRINPGLTVDNLIRHTLLMKKLARENPAACRGSSAEWLAHKQRHRSRGSPRKVLAGGQQRVRSARLKRRESLQTHSVEGLSRLAGGPGAKESLKARRSKKEQSWEQSAQVDTPTAHVHKRRIDNPFSRLPPRDPSGKQHGSQNPRLKNTRMERRSRAARVSQCLNPTGVKGADPLGEGSQGIIKPGGSCCLPSAEENSTGHPEKEHRRLGYTRPGLLADCQPQNCPRKVKIPVVPKVNHQSKHCRPAQSSGSIHLEQEQARQEVNHIDGPLPCSWQENPTASGLCAAGSSGSVERALPHRSSTQLVSQGQVSEEDAEAAIVPEAGGDQEQSETFTDNDETLYQGELDEDDACSSLYLNDDDNEITQLSSPPLALSFVSQTELEGSSAGLSNENWALTRILLDEPQTANAKFCTQQPTGWLEGSNGSLGPSKPWSEDEPYAQIHKHGLTSQLGYDHLEETEHPGGHRDLTSSVFNYCDVAAADSEPETLPNPPRDGDGNPDGRKLWAVHRGIKAQLRTMDPDMEFAPHSHDVALSQTSQEEHSHLETLENKSITGDSGIDSPRTRASLASNNSIVLSNLKRQSLMLNFGTLSSSGRSGVLSQHPLLQLTPVMNV